MQTLAWGASCPPSGPMPWILAGVVTRSQTGFTEGLFFRGGALFESTGNLQGPSVINRIGLPGGEVKILSRTPGNAFGEGLTSLGGQIFQLTYREKKLFVYNFDSTGIRLVATRSHPLSEGWGLTNDGASLIGSDGSDRISFFSPRTLSLRRILRVRDGRRPVPSLNSLQYVDGAIYANVFLTNSILKIDAQSGCVTAVLDMGALFAHFTPVELATIQGNRESVMNGIAYDPSADLLFVTGKNWPKIFKIKVNSVQSQR